MSAAAASAAASAAAPLREPSVPLATLIRVELRKTSDTRAGRWLLAVLALVVVLVTVGLALAGDADELTFENFFLVAQIPIAVLLPVVAILSITSEWSQRTALTTFALVPRRNRVVLAKLIAVVALALIAIAMTAVCAAIGNVLAGGDGSWAFSLDQIGEVLFVQAAGMAGAFGFGLAIQASAPAIVIYFVLPTAWGVLTSVVGSLEDPARWLDTARAYEPLGDGSTSALEWGRVATSTALWVLLPLAIGLLRLPRSEIK